MVIVGSVLVVTQLEGSVAAPTRALVKRARSVRVDDDFMFEEERCVQEETMPGVLKEKIH
jgi:hypothetical protein